MNVLVVHNFYQQGGGEDQVFWAETQALREWGVNVTTHTVHNDVIQKGSHLRTALGTVWNAGAARTLAQLVERDRIDVVHFHNTFPLISPAAYRAVRSRGAAVVQTLHNFRLLCVNALLFREGHVCEACLGHTLPWPGVQHACYRGSRAGSAVVAGMLTAHRLLGTYAREVDVYIALTSFARDKLIQGGLPADKLVIKSNFLRDPAELRDPADRGGESEEEPYALFVGRLSQEKGVGTLLCAWRDLGGRLPLKIVGDGPLAPLVEQAARDFPGVHWLGRQPSPRVLELMRSAQMLIFPSEWYEGFGITLLEAFASGLPVVASDLSAIPTIVQHGCTGRLFQPGDAADLAAQVRWLLDHPREHAAMRRAARQEYETRYTAERNMAELLDIYRLALSRRAARRSVPAAEPSA
ncbi:glycosyltransferase family 4 protein [Deinococcus geothermalis]|uniref:glycosyltransferase family 4 protein n=1 Tax=Deinococcus geothermalis TaxID=68909 RepID=UPI000051C6A5|nr:glycosyltransferase family 4 protein [Deinococcus geothermalis]